MLLFDICLHLFIFLALNRLFLNQDALFSVHFVWKLARKYVKNNCENLLPLSFNMQKRK